jgi:hypothetical protein
LREETLQTTAVGAGSLPVRAPIWEYVPLILVGLATAVVYGLSASPHMHGGDSTEFALIFAEGGVVHPSGYPLYTLILRLVSWLPVDSPAFGAALATASIGASAVTMLGIALVRWSIRPWVAACAASIFGFSRVFWELSTHAEVFALHALLGAAILAAVAPAGPRYLRGYRRALLLGLLAGAGLSNNHTLVFLAPIGLCGIVRAGREMGRMPLAFVLAAGAFIVGLLPYALLPLWSEGAWVWGDVQSAAGIWAHATRADFGSFSFGVYGDQHFGLAQLSRWIFQFTVASLFVGPLLAVLGYHLWLTERVPGLIRRAEVLCLLGSTFLAGPVLLFLMNLEPEGVAVRIIERFYVLPALLLTFPMAAAMEWLAMRYQLATARAWPAVVIIGYLQLLASLQTVTDHHFPAVHNYIVNTLEQVEPNAALLGTGDHRLFGYLYAQNAMELRPDVLVIDVSMMRYPWYRARIQAQLGTAPAGADTAATATSRVAGDFNSLQLIEQLVALGRPVYLTDVYSRAAGEQLPLIPQGALLRVAAPDDPPLGLQEVEELNIAALNRYQLDPDFHPTSNTWAALVYEDYGRGLRQLAQQYEQVGANGKALHMREILRRFAPQPPSNPWQE